MEYRYIENSLGRSLLSNVVIYGLRFSHRIFFGAYRYVQGIQRNQVPPKPALRPTNRQTTVPAVSAVYPNGEGSIALVFPSIREALRPFHNSARPK